MENGSPTVGFEDGTIDVECLLVEPQDGHVSMDSVICFNETITDNAMVMEDVSCSFGVTNTGIAQEGDDILNRDVLDSMRSEVEDEYFRLQNDFCSMGEEYLLGVEFAESITNLDYVSRDGLQTSVSDCSALASCAGIDTPWKADLFSTMEVPECQNDQIDVKSSEFDEIPSPCHESETLAEEKPLKSSTSCIVQGIGKFHDNSSWSFQDIVSDENDASFSPSVKMSRSPKNEKNDEFRLMGQNGETNKFQEQDALMTTWARASRTDALPTQKRSRKPTQRYIDELSDPIPRHPKRRREVSSSAPKDKSLVVKDHKKCHIGSSAMRLPAEESSVIAIQVPFGSLAQKECPKSPACVMVPSSDRGNPTTKLTDNCVTPENQKRRDECTTAIHLKRREECLMAIHLKKRDDSVTTACQKKRYGNVSAAHLKNRDERWTAPSEKKRDDCASETSPKKKVDCLAAVCQKKRDYYAAIESPEEVSGRRKHHRLWTIAEVRKLIDGVSEYGVGRWSRIKKLFFSASAHRTSVDLKDKWRNLLKASGIQEQGNPQGDRKRNLAWRPMPKSILRRVCELAAIYPYPKGRKHKIAHINHDSQDRSTDITLNDYRRILKSINSN